MTAPPPPPSPYNTGTTGGGGGGQQPPSVPGYLWQVKLASWPKRTLATLIDAGITVGLPGVLLSGNFQAIVMIVLVGLNSVFLQARTYQSFGKVLLGIGLAWPVDAPDGTWTLALPTYGQCILRVFVHIFDLFIVAYGFIRPARHPLRQTFADSAAKTVVVDVKPRPLRAPAGARSIL